MGLDVSAQTAISESSAMPSDHPSERERLRIGHGPWGLPEEGLPWTRQARSRRCGAIIVGGGITGALMAEHLTARGHDVVVIDRLSPGLGSTAASTAMLQWEIDRSVTELSDMKGLEAAAWAYRASFAAVQGLASLVGRLAIPCDFRWRDALFLADEQGDEAAVQREHGLRQRVGLPGEWLDQARLRERYGIDRAAAIVSPGAAEADPLFLARALLLAAISEGAELVAGDVVACDSTSRGASVRLASGIEFEAPHLILATGYALPSLFQAPAHRMTASWAAVTPAGTPLGFWTDRALVWEDAEPYIYARTTADGRILVGGEDEPVEDADERDSLSPEKARRLHDKLERLWGRALPPFESVWSAAFGETSDGLPLIGAVPGHANIYGAYGYGGNGITFSYLASRLIGAAIAGEPGDWVEAFALDRPAA